jgi:type I restriction enzyme, S subunit
MSVEVPEGWANYIFSDVVERIYGGGTPDKGVPEYWNGAIPWASVKDMATFDPCSTQDMISEDGLKNSSSKIVPAGNLIFCTRMAVGIVRRFSIDVAINQDLKAIIPSSRALVDFLYWWFQAKREFFEEMSTGTTVKGLRQTLLLDCKIILPPLPEQQRIAEILSSVDESIRATEAVIAQAERVKRGLMEDLLTGGLGRAAIAKGEVPEGWKVSQLSELFVVKSSKRVFERQWRKEGIPFYRGREITALSEDGYVNNDLFIDRELYEEFSRTNGVPKKNDVLITAIGTIGNTYLVDGSHEFYFKDASVLWLSSLNKVNSVFINFWLKSDLFSIQRDVGNGTTVDSLTIGQLGRLRVAYPSSEEQGRIAEILLGVDVQIENNSATIKEVKRLKRGLMDDLLTGRVRTVA